MASFAFVLLLPLGFIISYLNQHSWTIAQSELQEKHLMLAKSMEVPILQYVDTYKKSLNVFLDSTNFATKNSNEIKPLIHTFVNSLDNLSSISYTSINTGKTLISINDKYKVRGSNNLKPFSYHITESKYRKYDVANSVSSVIRSSVSRKPVVVISHHIIGPDQNKKGSIFIELELAPIADMCRKIRFGEKGHCAITDDKGQVIAHPKEELEDEIHNVAEIGILDKMREAKNGVWSFYSPILKEDMIAGYNTVEGLGWGIIIPQPESELESPFKAIINTIFTWLAVGIVISLLVAYILGHQITKPLNSLVRKSKEIGIRADTFNLGAIPKNSPEEVTELWGSLSALVDRLHDSNKEVRKLNYSLSKDIEKATAKLRATNLHLYKMSSLDHLTQIANRRFFEDTLNKVFKRNLNENVGIIVIDVDKFKHINDHYGHEAGDLALKHIANIMKENTRGKDIPARLGGDEFVAYIHNCEDKVLAKVADNLRKKVQDQPIKWEGQTIKLSLSVGTVNCHANQNYSLDHLLKFADEAMYKSKQAGRNSVSSYKFKTKVPHQDKLDKIKQLERQIQQSKIREKKKKIARAKVAKINALIEQQHKDDSLDIELLIDELPHQPEELTEEILAEKEETKPENVGTHWIRAK
ncbi:MAG: diguanylate cyclase (GGDEF)-like protein [Cocleimonas sp.]|jgi:diguanylate cyclase (GGDEF)-like protein